jgi:hypothetical protein
MPQMAQIFTEGFCVYLSSLWQLENNSFNVGYSGDTDPPFRAY